MGEEKALSFLLRHVDEAEIYFTSEISNRLILKKGKFDVHEWNKAQGYGIRVVKGGRMGFAFSNTLDEDVLIRAIKISKISEKDQNVSLPEKQVYGDYKPGYDEELAYLELEEALEYTRRVIDACEGHSVTPTIAGFSWSTGEERIINSHGIEAEEKQTYCTCHLSVVAKDKETATASDYEASRYLDIDFPKVGEKAARLARDSLGARKIDSGTYNLTLKPYALAELFDEVLTPSFSGENVVPDRSFLADKAGERLFSESLTIRDDGRLDKGLNTSAFDSEGVATQKTTLVDKGVVKDFLFDTYYANVAGAKSTGNAHRSSHSALPGVGASNFLIQGEGGLEERDLVVHGLMGAHTSNVVSGDFSVETKNAFHKGKPVKKLIIAGNIFELLKNITGYGKDFKQVSSILSPSVEFSDVKVAV